MNIYRTFVTKPEKAKKVFKKVRSKGIPEVFDQEFLTDLGLKKPNSVLYVNLFKKLGLIDKDGFPNQSFYPKFVGTDEQSESIIAQLVSEKYAEVFEKDKHAHKLPAEKLLSLFRDQMGNGKSKTIVKLVSNTFKALAQYADWDSFNSQNQTAKTMSSPGTEESETTSSEKPETPHEEFILELMNGDAHSYSANGSGIAKEKSEGSVESTTVEVTSEVNARTERAGVSKPDNSQRENSEKNEMEEPSVFLSKALLQRAELLESMDRLNEAIGAYDDIIEYSNNKKYPLGHENITNAFYKKASMLEKMGKSEKALAAYEDFIQRFG